MRTPIQYLQEPYPLKSNVIFFHDGRYVWEGNPRWRNAAGEKLEFDYYGNAPDPDDVWWASDSSPAGVRLRALPGKKSEPFLHVDKPWEDMLRHVSVLRDGGKYRMWYGTREHGCYAESDDALTWRKPRLGLCDADGNRDNNILFDKNMPSTKGAQSSGDVFIDPSAPPGERYKAFLRARYSMDAFAEFKAKHPGSIEPGFKPKAGSPDVLGETGAVSPDGIHWTIYPLPQVIHKSDTQNIAYYDTELKKYVGYFRTHVFGKRSIGRAETDDFRGFPLPETIVWPDASQALYDVWYGNGRASYPGAPDYHLMFCRRWRVAEDAWSVHLATSPDGIMWGFPPENKVLSPTPGRQWDSGAVTVGSGMVALPDGRVGAPILGYQVPHKYPRFNGLGKVAWATWEKDRLVALEAEEYGRFETNLVSFQGDTLHLNVRTKHVGFVQVEVLDSKGDQIEGRTFADCDFINGDYLDKVVTWRGESNLGRGMDEPVSFRVKLAYGQLFSMRFK